MKQSASLSATIEQLRVAFRAHADRPFPSNSQDEAASELHDDLAEWAGYVAGRVVTIINCGRLSIEDLGSNEDLRNRLESLCASSSPGAEDARHYLEYLSELDALLCVGRKIGNAR